MLKEKCDAWYEGLTLMLEEIAGQGLPALEQMTGSVKAVRETMAEMRAFVAGYQFDDEAEEAWFFKVGKPRCYALLIHAVMLFNVEHGKPLGTREELRAYYLEELEAVRRFFRQYAFLYAYFRQGMTEMDQFYFIRAAGTPCMVLPELPEPDPVFSTGADYLFSKFMALERLQDGLVSAIADLEPAGNAGGLVARKVRSLRWTGESINLVELGYGLYDSGQFNDGKAGIGEIFSWLEENLQVSIGIPARRFVEISRRKRLSRTKFLDQLRDAVNRKADEGDAFVPGKGNRKLDQ